MNAIGGFFTLWGLLLLLEIVLVVYALVNISRSSMDPTMKIVWVLVILVFPFLGSIASLVMNRPGSDTTVTGT
jgi:hypothetical protein